MSELMVRQEQAPAQRQIDDLMVIARNVATSKLVPKGIDTPEKAVIVMLKGRELGLKPMQSLSHIYVVNGAAAIDTKVMASLYLKRGNSFFPLESNADKCRIQFTNRHGDIFTFTLTMAECQQAHWHQSWDNETKAWKDKPTWKAMPSTMLYYRTLSTGIRRVDPGCLLDTLTDDEILDIEPPDMAEEQTIEGQATVMEPEPETAEPAATGEPVSAQPAPNATAPHWSKNNRTLTAFWAWAKQRGLKTDEVHQALGVVHLADYEGTEEEARKQILAYASELSRSNQ